MTQCRYDYLIVGQGLAGTCLAWQLRWLGASVVVVDRGAAGTASRISAGLITPITGQRAKLSWRFEELWPSCREFYHLVAAELGEAVLRETAMVRLPRTAEEAAALQRLAAGRNSTVRVREIPLPRGLRGSHGAYEMTPAAQLDALRFLDRSRECLAAAGTFIAADVDVRRDIRWDATGVTVPSLAIAADQVIFCQGADALDHACFAGLRFKPAKGEILTLDALLSESRPIHARTWLAPAGFGRDGDAPLFRAGSTYEWDRLDNLPTEEGRQTILRGLHTLTGTNVRVVDHDAAIRPAMFDSHPVLGRHPDNPRLAIFNGLGAKGALWAPFFSRQLALALHGGAGIDAEVSLNRKGAWQR